MHIAQRNIFKKHKNILKKCFIKSKKEKIKVIYVQIAEILQFVKRVTNMLHYCKKI